eukprot:m.686735 g.686735  ORF g.686735 m.686735 type:complete len:75 (+) comp58626_c0_seq75:675-899(+)
MACTLYPALFSYASAMRRQAAAQVIGLCHLIAVRGPTLDLHGATTEAQEAPSCFQRADGLVDEHATKQALVAVV